MRQLLSIENLKIVYGDSSILYDISLSLDGGNIVPILGANNSGKSSLIKCLSGISDSFGGKIYINNILLCKKNIKEYMVNIGTILEDVDKQFICEKVEDEIEFPLIHLSLSKRKINKQVSLISDICKVSDILDKNIDKLSYFEKIKVLIATSVVHSPKVLLIDDVLKYLDDKEKYSILDILNNLKNKYNMLIIFTTSNLFDVKGFERIIVLGNHEIAMDGSYAHLLKQDNELSKLGIVIPIMVDLSRKLQFYNLVDKVYYDVDKVVNALWK